MDGNIPALNRRKTIQFRREDTTMVPEDVVYAITQCYVRDHEGVVDPKLLAHVDGCRRARDVGKLATCSLQFDQHTHSVDDWRFLRQVEAFFKKNALFSVAQTCFDAAQCSFKTNEEQCRSTNLRLRPLIEDSLHSGDEFRLKVYAMQRYIRNVLGDFQSFLEELPRLIKVTPGATANTSRRDSLPQQKLTLKPFCTMRAKPYVTALYRYYGFGKVRIRETSSNRVELVPKNWKTDRTIACEPEANLPLQLAFDTWAKRKLKKFGIRLNDQSANQRRAKHGSIHNDFVTVDFASASDTVAFNTVHLLFPVDWYRYLMDVRAPKYRGVFGEGVYEKFSSMGNGSTFAIETLIFAAACWAVGSRNFLVYGDDVIIGKEYYEDFVALTGFLGFTVNRDKTYHDGPFRESCGKDFYGGVDVTPVFIRNIDERKASLCHLVNTLLTIAFPGMEMWEFLTNLIKERKLPYTPYSESTLAGVWLDPAVARRRGVLRYGKKTLPANRQYEAKAYVPLTERRNFVDSRGYYLWFLYKNSQVLFAGPWELNRGSRFDPTVTSSVPVFRHKYVRRWVHWQPPMTALPDHLLSLGDG